VPPAAVTEVVPLLFPQVVAVDAIVSVMAGGCVIVYVLVIIHPLASVTVAV
jgi:hypothetical protein